MLELFRDALPYVVGGGFAFAIMYAVKHAGEYDTPPTTPKRPTKVAPKVSSTNAKTVPAVRL